LELAAPRDLISGINFPLDGYVLLFTATAGFLAALISGSAPAWHMSRVSPFHALRESGQVIPGGRGVQRFRSLLVAGELAMGLVLLAGTALLLKSLTRIGEVAPGFQPHGVMSAALSLPPARYSTPEQQMAFFRGVLDHLSSAPGVAAAGAGFPLPFTGGNDSASFEIEGRPLGPGDPGPHGDVRHVTPGYFTALGIPLRKGRLLTDDDRQGSEPVVVIDENLAREYWPGEDPTGKRIRRGNNPWATIVGIVGHIRFNQLAGEESSAVGTQSSAKGVYYYPLYQTQAPFGFLIARTAGDPQPLAQVIRRAVRDTDPAQPISDMKSMDARIAESLGTRRFAADLLAGFAALAILLTAVGLYGLISYSVSQRTGEIGIRTALGAGRADILLLVLRQGTALALGGAAVGVAAGMALARTMRGLLYGVSTADPLSFAVAVAAQIAVALAACWLPARRAARVDPLVALRHE
jgi:predicted permease